MTSEEKKDALEEAVEATKSILLEGEQGFVFVLKKVNFEHKDHSDEGYYCQAIGNRMNNMELIGYLERAKMTLLEDFEAKTIGVQ